MNRSQSLKQAGQSVWYDNIERGMLLDGEMARMVKEGEVYGVTSNPSIFEKSISSSASSRPAARRSPVRPSVAAP